MPPSARNRAGGGGLPAAVARAAEAPPRWEAAKVRRFGPAPTGKVFAAAAAERAAGAACRRSRPRSCSREARARRCCSRSANCARRDPGPPLHRQVRRLRRGLHGFLSPLTGEGVGENEQAAQKRQRRHSDPSEEGAGDRPRRVPVQPPPDTHRIYLPGPFGSKRQRAFLLPI